MSRRMTLVSVEYYRSTDCGKIVSYVSTPIEQIDLFEKIIK